MICALSWRYRTEDDLGGSSHSGILASYSGAGSVQVRRKKREREKESQPLLRDAYFFFFLIISFPKDLHSLKNESAAIIKELKEGLWVTRGTRQDLDACVLQHTVHVHHF